MAITRRKLFVATGVGAGLFLGWVAWPRKHPVSWSAGQDEHLLNAWVKIGLDGRVTIAAPQAEMGQGIWSGMAQILADELGADWRTVGVEPAPLAADYVNLFIATEPLNNLSDTMRTIAQWTARRVVEYFEMQLTGGSSSIRGFEAPLRAAGATAREMLCKAAAARWSVSWEDCDTENGFVIHKANRLSFAELVAEAARMDPPAEPRLRPMPAEGKARLTSKPLLRLDIPSKVDGTARFGADVRLPGMGHAAIQQGPLGATRTRIDKRRLPAGCLLVEEPDFVAVVADNWWQARQGLESLVIDHTPAETPAGDWIEAALANAVEDPGQLPVKQVRAEGGAMSLITAPVETTITAEYSLPYLAHACMEPMTATARLEEGRCEIWAPVQSLTLATWAAARTLDIPDEKVIVYPTFLGGGFGRKIENDAISQVVRIARKAGRPVQLVWSREEDFAHDKFRPAARARLAARLTGKDLDSRIEALAARLAVQDLGTDVVKRNLPRIAGDHKPGGNAFEGMMRMPYAIPAVALEHVLIDVPVPVGFWRSVGHSYTAFMMESFMDELAEKAGLDPLAFRLIHLQDQPRHTNVLRTLSTMAGPPGGTANGDGSISGAGLALWESFGSIVAMLAEVVVKKDAPPKVIRLNIAADCGRVINPDSVKAQLESAALYGLTAALYGAVSFEDGEARQRNFDTYPLLDMASSPQVEIMLIESDAAPGGAGEIGTPPVAPAVANALVAAKQARHRKLPLLGPVV